MVKVLITLGITLTLMLQALPASAEAARVLDARRDVSYYDWEDDERYTTSWGMDIASVRVDHQRDRIVAVMKFHSLRRGWFRWADVMVNVDGDRGPEYRFGLWDDGEAGVYRGVMGMRAICAATVNVNYSTDTIRYSAPRSCFGNPAWIEAWGDAYDSWNSYDVDCCKDTASDDTGRTRRVRRD